MSDSFSGIGRVADTAWWVAFFRARESQRPDALFKDPYAKRLAGARGAQIASSLPQKDAQELACVVRTYLFDQFLMRLLSDGTDMVVNLAAGLDTRPYRMELPSGLEWVEVDLPEVISYKEEILCNAPPHCRLQRVALDLFDVDSRRALLSSLNKRASKITVLSEGMLQYWSPMQVSGLAVELARQMHFRNWIIDLWSTIQLILMQRTVGKGFGETDAEFKFGPPEGVNFFKQFGWEPGEIQGLLKNAANFNRAPGELLERLPEPDPIPPNYPWAGVCLLQKHK